MPHAYETDGAAIYRQSFATIRREADLARFTADEEPVVVRMIHAAGMVGLEAHVRFTPGMAAAARAALQKGAPILCDARMVSEGITRARLPANNAVICTLDDPACPACAGPCRTPARRRRWSCGGRISQALSSPSAMRRPRCFICSTCWKTTICPRPAAIIGCPVGFVGAAESKAALMAAPPAPALTVEGRLGGSAITVAAVNALASRSE